MDIFKQYGLSSVINGRGPATIVGASKVAENVIDYISSILKESVDMRQMQNLANHVISKYSGAEAGCVTGCTAAGIAIGVASFLTKSDMAKITQLPKTIKGPRNIVIQKAHMISGGGCSIEQLIRISGADIIEIGESADCALFQLHAALDNEIAGAIFVMGGRSNTPGTIQIKTFINICHEHNIPVLIDAAGDVNIKYFVNCGADLVVASVQKWLGGPTAGLIAGRSELVNACFLNGEFGIGRPMKVGKEGIAGMIGALETYSSRNNPKKKNEEKQIIDNLLALLENTNGLSLEIIYDLEESPSSVFLKINIDPEKTGIPAWEINDLLLKANPRIALDAHRASNGYLCVDPGLLKVGEEEIIAKIILEIISNNKKMKHQWDEPMPRFETMVSYMQNWRNDITN